MALIGTGSYRAGGYAGVPTTIAAAPAYATTAAYAAPTLVGTGSYRVGGYAGVPTTIAAAPAYATTAAYAAPTYATTAAYAAPAYATAAYDYGAPYSASYDVGLGMACVMGGSSAAAEYSALAAQRDSGVATGAFGVAVNTVGFNTVSPTTAIAAPMSYATAAPTVAYGGAIAAPVTYGGGVSYGYGGGAIAAPATYGTYGAGVAYGGGVTYGGGVAYGGGLVGTRTLPTTVL
jgi:hypothetical protein